MRTIVWFREKDLRLRDHLPLVEGLNRGEVIPLYIVDPAELSPRAASVRPHRTQFLLQSLQELASECKRKGSRLVVVADEGSVTLARVVQQSKAQRVVAHAVVDPARRARDARLQNELGSSLTFFGGETLLAPGTLRTRVGKPYAVFTHFARAFGQSTIVRLPTPQLHSLPTLPADLNVDELEIPSFQSLGLTRNPSVQRGGERAAHERLRLFLEGAAVDYPNSRDRMDQAGTSRLSADLVMGTISVHQVWNSVEEALGPSQAAHCYLNQLLWREFNLSTLWDRPELIESPFRPEFVDFPWRDNDRFWQAWIAGETGYPIVDAAARQLLKEGYVHNRARMISASFLTKHLLVHYGHGEAHYMKYLTDGDTAQNNAGWQWCAGCGCDAQPYFRVFNPILQGMKFDPAGDYVRRWVPDLVNMPARYIHRPWEAPSNMLREAKVRLGDDYPFPIVDHRQARQRFLGLAKEHLRRHRATIHAA